MWITSSDARDVITPQKTTLAAKLAQRIWPGLGITWMIHGRGVPRRTTLTPIGENAVRKKPETRAVVIPTTTETMRLAVILPFN
jgi:hypothetical protein